MKYSIKSMMCGTTVVALALGVGQLIPAIQLAVLAIIIVPLFFVVKENVWRTITYGGFLGIGFFGASAWSISIFLHQGLPRRTVFSRYQSDTPEAIQQYWELWGMLIVPMGFVIGASVFTYLANRNSNLRTEVE